MKNITYSAPAKIILSGEHGVVYGKPALVSAIERTITVTVSEKAEETHTPSTKQDPQLAHVMDSINKKVLHYLTKNNVAFEHKQFTYSIQNDIPIGRGMGSSAALAVVASAALLHLYTGGEYAREIVNKIAYSSEKDFHGNPSGVDNSTSCYGGLIYYRKEFEFLKNISALNFKLPATIEQNLFLIDTGKPKESTAEMVALVGKNYNKDSKKMEQLFSHMEKVTKRMVVSIVKEDSDMFQSCVAENETILEEIGVVANSCKKLLKELDQFGIGKVTGAGGATEGSGFVLFFAKDTAGLIDYLDKKNIPYYSFKQNFEGVKRELI